MSSDMMESKIMLPPALLAANNLTGSMASSSAPLMMSSSLPFGGSFFDSLVKATEIERQSPADMFRAMVDQSPITSKSWSNDPLFGELSALTQRSPSFVLLDHMDINSHACLTITDQPGPVFVANAHSASGSFRVQLLPHPLMPAQALKTWKVGPLKVTLLNDSEEEAKVASKKRGRPNKPNSKPVKRKTMSATLNRDYTFDKLDISITDLTFPASGCRPMRLEFSCTIMDPLNRVATFSVLSNAFMIISNCNQWKDGLGICLRNFIFPDGVNQAPFNRFFNYLHMAYLDSKGFDESRYLEPIEIKNWLLDCASHELRLDRERQLLEVHNTVTDDLFEAWFEVAGPVLYDLHTSNVGKLFQKLWAAGFVGIGTKRDHFGDLDYVPGHFRLSINTQQTGENARESYLVLQSRDMAYSLLALERDHLAYFFEHSRNSQGCTHLISATNPDQALPIESIFVQKPPSSPLSPHGTRVKREK
jgi:hypothetical protein